jgi:PAS domain S-box-containing protein
MLFPPVTLGLFSLPSWSVTVLFRDSTFWELYKWRIVSVLLLCGLQTLLIAVLLLERSRRRRTSVSLENSEEKYRNVVETQTELICRFRPDTTLTFVNDAYCRYFNQTREALIGKKFVEFLPAIHRNAALQYYASLVRHPLTETREHQVVRTDGSIGWQQWVNHVITNGGGRVVELQGIGRDVTKRKLAEEDLLRSEREFSTLVENSPDVISRLDRDLRYIYISPALERISGVATYELIGRTPQEIALPGYDWNSFEAGCREAISTGQTVVREFAFEKRQYRTRIIPEFSPDGSIDSVMTISEDVTERLRAEQELVNLTARLFSLQDEERRRIARELHDGAAQNLFGITINLGNLEKHKSDPVETSRLIAECQSLAEQTLQEVRTFSYLLHPPILDQAGLALALQWYVEGFTKRSGIYVDLLVLEDIGRLSLEVETALFRIVQESLTNIRRHSGSETASIRLEKKASEVTLKIADQGTGMPTNGSPDSIESIAELGVGIPGMRQRLRQLGGRLQIESTDHGTTIVAVVPAAEGNNHGEHLTG